jgi:hypothetical protein
MRRIGKWTGQVTAVPRTITRRFVLSGAIWIAASACAGAETGSRIRLHFPVHRTAEVVRYRSDGQTERITDPIQVRDFLGEKLDLVIHGILKEGGHIIDSPCFDGIWLDQFGMTSIRSSRANPLWRRIRKEEEAFLHAGGLPPVRSNRLMLRCSRDTYGREAYMLYPSRAWREAICSEAWEKLKRSPRLGGFFVDNAWTSLPSDIYVRRVVDERHQIDGPDIIPEYLLSQACPNDISVVDDRGRSLRVEHYDSRRIVLADSPDRRITVRVSYDALADPDPSAALTWSRDMLEAFRSLRRTTEDKLILYNGVVSSSPADDPFLQYADGGMEEQWAVLHDREARWRKNLDELCRFNDLQKVFLAQTLHRSDSDFAKAAMFSFASFLLGTGPTSYYNFARNDYQTYWYFDYWATDLGAPLESYRVLGRFNGANVYGREFANALVLVNPGDKMAPVSLEVQALTGYWGIRGIWQEPPPTSARELIPMPPKSGLVLVRRPDLHEKSLHQFVQLGR